VASRLVAGSPPARLEIVAAAGWGKTEALLDAASGLAKPVLWRTLGPVHRDPHALVRDLARGASPLAPEAAQDALAMLSGPGGGAEHGARALNRLAEGLLTAGDPGGCLVLDGLENLSGGPDALHLLDGWLEALGETWDLWVAGREPLATPLWRRARLQGHVRTLEAADLALDADETRAIATGLGLAPSDADIESLREATGGWPLGTTLALRHPGSRYLDDLETFLETECFAPLEPEFLALLERLAPLERVLPSVVEQLVPGGSVHLGRGVRQGLLLADPDGSGGTWPAPIRQALARRLRVRGSWTTVCREAVEALVATGLPGEALELALESGPVDAAWDLAPDVLPAWLEEGLVNRATTVLERLRTVEPPHRLTLRFLEAHLSRARGDVTGALAALAAGGSEPGATEAPWALRLAMTRARLHLETVEPARAAEALDQAQVLAGEGPHAVAIALARAENLVNLGDVPRAAALLATLEPHTPGLAVVKARLALRTGDPDQVETLLGGLPAGDGRGGHREPALLRALVLGLTGRPEEALALAEETFLRAERAGSPVTRLVAATRCAHALAALGRPAEARARHAFALALAEHIGVPRLGAESRLGLALLETDREAARSGITTALRLGEEAGDPWFSALVAVGRALLAPDDDTWRDEARSRTRAVGDRWLEETLDLGGRGWLRALPRPETGPSGALALPATPPGEGTAGSILRIRTFGGLRVSVGDRVLGPRDWTRDRARQLLGLLAAHPGEVLPKARIIDMLWPDLDPDQADGTFRVVLNALQRTLEPGRPAKVAPRFVRRSGSGYELAGPPDIEVDTQVFSRLVTGPHDEPGASPARLERLARALEVAHAPFLPEFLLEEPWCDRLRDHLEARVVETALSLARQAWEAGRLDLARQAAEVLVERDPAGEEGWRVLVAVLARSGERTLALRAYDRCIAALARELDDAPSPAMGALARALRDGSPLPSPWTS
jgi:DNA-binding SARP family transcriptional activator